ncbi:MAG: GGDEF domain-containing protein [Chloroflexi bacterium]|nr:GGDEF domain-containing protein [Chloroflexota bacterium]
MASALLVGLSWLIAIGFVFLSGGMKSAGVVYLVAAATMGGILLGERGAFAITLLSLSAGLGMVGLDFLGVMLPRIFNMNSVMSWTALALSLVVTTLVVNYVVRDLSSALAMAQAHIETRKHAEAQLHRIAQVDDLTGLFNRRHFFELVHPAVANSPPASLFALLMIDADHFKAINDQYGHSVGDRVLEQLAQTLTQTVRLNDVVARYGGEEFVLFLNDISPAQAHQMAERLRESVAAHPFQLDGAGIPLTISIGVAMRNSANPSCSLDPLITRADRALYQAKQNGRNCCVIDRGEP